MQPTKRLRATLLVTSLIASVLAVANPTVAAAEADTCTTGVYPDAQTAKSKFDNDCGDPFKEALGYRCDWVPGGWVCTGPGRTTNPSAPTPRAEPSASKPPAPSIIQVEKEPRYVNVVWRPDARIKGVDVYRDGRWLASVNSPNNVYNDYGGREGATYELIAYGHGSGADQYSDRSVMAAGNDQMDPVVNLHVEVVGENRVVLNWTRANREVTGWWIYRNGSSWKYLPAGQGHQDEIFDNDASSAFTYEVKAVRGGLQSPRVGSLGPAVDDYLAVGPTGRDADSPMIGRAIRPWPGDNRPPVEGLPATNATTRSLAARAEASSATAQKEHEDFQNARQGLATAVGSLGLPQTGGIANPRNWFSVGVAGLETRTQRIEAEAANKQAYEDLEAYRSCVASNCGAPSPTSGGPSDGPSTGSTPAPQVGGNQGATRPGELGDGLRG